MMALDEIMPEKKNILIVEDEKPLAHAIELKLNHDGYATELAHDGLQALSAIEKRGIMDILS